MPLLEKLKERRAKLTNEIANRLMNSVACPALLYFHCKYSKMDDSIVQEGQSGTSQVNENAQILTDKNDLESKIKDLFGEEVLNAFKREQVVNEMAISDLLERKADATIFQRLSLCYGKAVIFKKEFSFLKRQKASFGAKTSPSPPPKPTMADLQQLNPEMKHLYLTKRKKIGVLAANKWTEFPKFNSPEAKAELDAFAENIEKECGIKEINFGKEGIKKHIQSFCNEQRRYNKKRKRPSYDDDYKIPSSQAIKKEMQSNHSSSDLEESSVDLDREGEQDEHLEQDGSSAGDTEILSDDEMEGSQCPISPKIPKPSTSTSSPEDAKAGDQVEALPLKIKRAVIKSVFGKQLTREVCVDVLKNKFFLKSNALTSLSPSQAIAVLIRKLVSQKYVEFKTPPSQITSINDVNVLKEISLI
ncbi:uncharacterized protein LOC116617942 [Nematostella vectensis]|uniref:uncharacterized protein LOC116617942 n=1 Tax=Nematostella vectensis TaxID=45351 RepID=UPI0020777441|nr:uncharacterized protein LOC116617942 [Nematostella vectensis]